MTKNEETIIQIVDTTKITRKFSGKICLEAYDPKSFCSDLNQDKFRLNRNPDGTWKVLLKEEGTLVAILNKVEEIKVEEKWTQ